MRDMFGSAFTNVLAILGVLSLVAIYIVVTRGNDVSDATQKLLTIRGELAEAYRNQPGRYGTALITPQTLQTLGAVSDDMIISSTQLANTWGGQLVVTGNGQSIYIDMDNIPMSDCAKLVTNQSAGSGFVSFAVGSDLAAAQSASPSAVPVQPGSTGCTAGSNAVRVTMQ